MAFYFIGVDGAILNCLYLLLLAVADSLKFRHICVYLLLIGSILL